MSHIPGAHRHVVRLLPERLAADMAAEKPGRFLAACIEVLALAAGGFQRAVPAAPGRPGSAPGALLTRALYGARSRRRSRRRLAQERQRHGRAPRGRRRPEGRPRRQALGESPWRTRKRGGPSAV
jgi:hypothetical protein